MNRFKTNLLLDYSKKKKLTASADPLATVYGPTPGSESVLHITSYAAVTPWSIRFEIGAQCRFVHRYLGTELGSGFFKRSIKIYSRMQIRRHRCTELERSDTYVRHFFSN